MKKIVLAWVLTVNLLASAFDPIFDRAGRDFGIDPSLLKRIATIESSLNPNALNRNKNGTVDIGLMQINTIHLKRLSKIGVTQALLYDPEVNIYVAALLLSSHIRKGGYNLETIGRYHSANPMHKRQWLKRLSMATIPNGKNEMNTASADDPRSRFVQQQLMRRTDEKIALGLDPKQAWREAKAEVERMMGYDNTI